MKIAQSVMTRVANGKYVDLNEKNQYSTQYHKHYLKTYGTFKPNFRKDWG